MLLNFEGKTAVVTGGANGIGLAAARLLRSSGATVWVFDRQSERPEEVAASFASFGVNTDVTDRAALESAFAQVGEFDILVANAGTVVFKTLTDTTPADWDRVLSVNLSGMFHSIQIAAQTMKKLRRGSIVLTASTNSFDGEQNLIAYNASKAGVLGLLHTAANELGPYQIRVNAVCPGLIRTRLTEEAFQDTKGIRNYFRHIPLGRGGAVTEVANGIAFLASDAASYVTGTALTIDGGQLASKFGTWSEESADFFGDRWWLR
jgi:NAD(P)-dependent dehydrogenase (short-subunit alcohol dehydrogenase family)